MKTVAGRAGAASVEGKDREDMEVLLTRIIRRVVRLELSLRAPHRS